MYNVYVIFNINNNINIYIIFIYNIYTYIYIYIYIYIFGYIIFTCLLFNAVIYTRGEKTF